MDAPQSSEQIRKAAMALDNALERKDLKAVTEKFADDCEIELLTVKLLGKEGVSKWFNWIYTHIAKIKFLPIVFLGCFLVGSSRVDLQACKLEYSIVSPK